MEEKLLKYLLVEYYDLVEENIRNGHFVETDFVNYARLVQSLVNNAKNIKDTLFLTGLCIPPFKWYNFNIEALDKERLLEIKSVKDVKTMQTDQVWVNYLKFVKQLSDQQAKVYRFIFSAESGFSGRTLFKDLVENSTINAQFEAHIIFPKDDTLRPLTKEEIHRILRDRINKDYTCYNDITKAYLIIDENDLNTIKFDINLYENSSLHDHFAIFQPIGCYHQWIYKKSHGLGRKFPEDFFMFGTGSLQSAHWHVVLAADVAPGLNKVTLWFMTEHLPAKRYSNGAYKGEFDFNSFKDFINNIVIPDSCQK